MNTEPLLNVSVFYKFSQTRIKDCYIMFCCWALLMFDFNIANKKPVRELKPFGQMWFYGHETPPYICD